MITLPFFLPLTFPGYCQLFGLTPGFSRSIPSKQLNLALACPFSLSFSTVPNYSHGSGILIPHASEFTSFQIGFPLPPLQIKNNLHIERDAVCLY